MSARSVDMRAGNGEWQHQFDWAVEVAVSDGVHHVNIPSCIDRFSRNAHLLDDLRNGHGEPENRRS